MVKWSMLLLAFLGLTHTACAEQLGIRDIKMGMPLAEVQTMADMNCSNQICSNHIPIKNRPVTAYYFFEDGKLTSISLDFAQLNYDVIKAALTEKWGAPTSSEVAQWISKGGVKLDNPVFRWNLPEGSIKLSFLGDRIKFSSVFMASSESLEAAKKRKLNDMTQPGF